MMNPGSETGSLVNHLYSRMTKGSPKPEVGMAATVLGWTDRHPATVISIEKNIVTVQHDTATRVDTNGMSEIQEYEYSRNTEGQLTYFKISKDGSFSEVYKSDETGRWRKFQGSSYGLILGRREKYYDYSF